jgi:mannose-1-phosphate guanylyltransferase/mannose-6-phosphate isomerase
MALRDRLTVPVLLSGGSGTRLWPLSRETYPKQLLPLLGDKTLLQQTALRVTDRSIFARIIMVGNIEHRFIISEQLRAVGVTDPMTILEPVGRNTAPAIATAALVASESDPDAIMLVMPVDHLVRDAGAFRQTVHAGMTAADDDQLVLFGIPPTGPATGYRYVRVGSELPIASGVHRTERFVEKPTPEAAQQFCAAGDFLWNSGIFLLPAKALLKEMERFAPGILAAARAALMNGARDPDFLRLAEEPFSSCEAKSIDYAVMEKTDKSVVVPAKFDWNDVGSWSSLWDVGEKDSSENVAIGDVIAEDSTGCYLHSDGPLVAALGVDDLVITAMPDVVLVSTRNRVHDVKKLVERLKSNGHHAATQTPCVRRPWGYYQPIHNGERFQVKRITVNPGAKLSLQKHFHRAEHWIVVNGTALVTRDGEETLLRENESVFVPLGCMHRLENPGRLPLNLIEVQSGPYLGEDDIVRIEDIYHRN